MFKTGVSDNKINQIVTYNTNNAGMPTIDHSN